MTSRLELSVKVLREQEVTAGTRTHRESEVVYDSTISIPVKSTKTAAIQQFVDQWLAMMDMGLKLIATQESE